MLRDNLFGLELDPALRPGRDVRSRRSSAWKASGMVGAQLPIPSIACSGIPVKAPRSRNGQKLAQGDSRLGERTRSVACPVQGRRYPRQPYRPQTSRSRPQTASRAASRQRRLGRRSHHSSRKPCRHGDRSTPPLQSSAQMQPQASPAPTDYLLATTYTLVATNVPYLDAQRDNGVRHMRRLHRRVP